MTSTSLSAALTAVYADLTGGAGVLLDAGLLPPEAPSLPLMYSIAAHKRVQT
jgi:hypothetical protein